MRTRTTTISELPEDLRLVVGQIIRRFRADGPLPGPQMSVLALLFRQGPKTTSQLAGIERVRPQSMAHTVSELEAASMVQRQRDPADGRQLLVELTERGRKTFDDYRRAGDSWVTAAIDERLSAQEQHELARGIELLGRLLESD